MSGEPCSGDGLVPQDSSTETLELEGIVRQLGELLRGSPPLDWQENRERCANVLQNVAEGCTKSSQLADRIEDAEFEIGGSEHILIRFEDEQERIFKATFNDNLGCISYFSPNPASKILLTDAAPRNVRVVDGIPVPFDAMAEIASPRVVEWARGRGIYGSPLNTL